MDTTENAAAEAKTEYPARHKCRMKRMSVVFSRDPSPASPCRNLTARRDMSRKMRYLRTRRRPSCNSQQAVTYHNALTQSTNKMNHQTASSHQQPSQHNTSDDGAQSRPSCPSTVSCIDAKNYIVIPIWPLQNKAQKTKLGPLQTMTTITLTETAWPPDSTSLMSREVVRCLR